MLSFELFKLLLEGKKLVSHLFHLDIRRIYLIDSREDKDVPPSF